MKVLIIEDEEPIVEHYKSYFLHYGFEVVTTGYLEVAIKIIKENPNIEIITLDANLLDSRAPETLKRIEEIRKLNSKALLVVISGVLTPLDAERAIIYGADGIAEKIDISTELSFWKKLKSIFNTPLYRTRNSILLDALLKKLECEVITPPPSEN